MNMMQQVNTNARGLGRDVIAALLLLARL